VRLAASLKRSSQASLPASYHGTAGITRIRETGLAERELTVASPVWTTAMLLTCERYSLMPDSLP
jgi:hypothetical protein